MFHRVIFYIYEMSYPKEKGNICNSIYLKLKVLKEQYNLNYLNALKTGMLEVQSEQRISHQIILVIYLDIFNDIVYSY